MKMERLVNRGLKAMVFEVTFPFSKWNEILGQKAFALWGLYLSTRTENFKSLTLQRRGHYLFLHFIFLMKNFQLFLKREKEHSLNCDENVDLIKGNIIEKLFLNRIGLAQRILLLHAEALSL